VFFGWIALIATLVAAAIGLAAGDKGWIPSAGVFVLAGLASIIVTA
jgi:hypothetical protein